MKRFFNLFAILLTICLASTAFISCSSDDDDDDPSVVAVWKGTDGDITITFYDNSTVSVVTSEGTYSGTYTGSATSDGTVTVSVAGETITITISGTTATDSDGDIYTKQ